MEAKRQQFDSPCSEYADLLVDLSDGELSAVEERQVRQHVAYCTACLAELNRLDRSLRRLQSPLVEPARSRVALRPSRRIAWPATIAAAFLLAIGLSALRWQSTPNAARDLAKAPSVERSSATLITSSDALRQIALMEQQARLQTSLDLLPADASNAAEREQTKTIVETLRRAASGPGETL